jgi:hypothetical protein
MGLTTDGVILLVALVGAIGALVILGPKQKRPLTDEPEHEEGAGGR